MSAPQAGSAILLDYRPQPPQAQAGGAIVLDYATALARRVVRASVAAPWRRPDASRSPYVSPIAMTVPADGACVAPWRIARPQGSRRRVPWGVAGTADAVRVAPWERFERSSPTRAALPWGVAAIADRAAVVPWGAYRGRPRAGVVPIWAAPRQADIAAIAPWGILAAHGHPLAAVMPQGVPAGREWIVPWVRYSRPLNPGWGVVTPPDETPVDEHGTVLVPILGAYIVINEVYLTRSADGAVLEASDLNMSIDVQSWTWGWSATIPAAQLPLVRPAAYGEMVELMASINGNLVRLVVETIARDRRFASATLRIAGRGHAAWLSAPHSPVQTRYNAEARTAAQLLDEALTLNEASIGWTVDWQAADWLVTAGAWSHTGTYIDAATRLAEAAGAYVQAHDTDPTLRVLPWYPAMPWNWADQTPDIQIPEDVCEVEGIEWQDKPAYNAVWIHGAQAGRRDRIKRAGSAADNYAQTVVDPLATAPQMTMARGGRVLADTGRQAHISLRLPVLPETGLIKPGALVRYQEQGNTHLGIARALTLQHQFPDLWQTARIETHVQKTEPEEVEP